MAVSLGTRVSALLFVGAIAVATAAVTDPGGSAPRGGAGTNLSGGTAGGPDGVMSGGPVAEVPPASPSPGPSALGSGGAEADTSAPRAPGVSRTPSPSGPTTAAPAAPAWLPPGPVSPDTDHRPDPDSVYDLLRSPDRCRDALAQIPRASVGDDWKVLRGLAHACLAVQGRESGGWAAAERDRAALTGVLNTCKGRAAERVLAGLLAFHRSRPSATARLTAAPVTAAPACAYAIASVDVGGDGEARPGDPIRIELRGTYFDHAELLREGTVLVGGRPAAGPLHAVAQSGDGLVLAAVVPDLGLGAAQGSVGVTVSVRYATTEAVKVNAFRVPGPEVSGPTQNPGASGSPGGPGGSGGPGGPGWSGGPGGPGGGGPGGSGAADSGGTGLVGPSGSGSGPAGLLGASGSAAGLAGSAAERDAPVAVISAFDGLRSPGPRPWPLSIPGPRP
ncbi:hypothetical protein [Streptomyces griseoruber]|uniref:Uncharacterized protein n=1 Tax=Streptomyces griseoruber TaxID=1943 RepID=A0A101SNF2_9ACTN|nr:hypothetical protein [Streptomyces griseoruber]KUN77167.1 hypothetical protein AQJ64_34715 [Streptomyces griseoruber]